MLFLSQSTETNRLTITKVSGGAAAKSNCDLTITTECPAFYYHWF